MSLDHLLSLPQYSLSQREKAELLLPELVRLTNHHIEHSPQYRRIAALWPNTEYNRLEDIPYLPVTLFKTHRLLSVPEADVFKTMTSSGTTGAQVSKIVLDRETAQQQTKALASVMTHVIGPKRIPMIVIDTPNVVRDRTMFSARGAGVLGMISYGHHHFYALNDDMELDIDGLRAWLEQWGDGPVLLFGFTFMVWKYFYEPLQKAGVSIPGGILIHSGGWKKLIEQAVDNDTFKAALRESLDISSVHNFYGMVEQVGGVFLEGPDGYLHPPNIGDVIIRDPLTFEPVPEGTPGLIQVLSALPTSYPGHSILTEDLGIVHGVGSPETGWGGKQLQIIGRIPKSELRGCSDTHAQQAQGA